MRAKNNPKTLAQGRWWNIARLSDITVPFCHHVDHVGLDNPNQPGHLNPRSKEPPPRHLHRGKLLPQQPSPSYTTKSRDARGRTPETTSPFEVAPLMAVLGHGILHGEGIPRLELASKTYN